MVGGCPLRSWCMCPVRYPGETSQGNSVCRTPSWWVSGRWRGLERRSFKSIGRTTLSRSQRTSLGSQQVLCPLWCPGKEHEPLIAGSTVVTWHSVSSSSLEGHNPKWLDDSLATWDPGKVALCVPPWASWHHWVECSRTDWGYRAKTWKLLPCWFCLSAWPPIRIISKNAKIFLLTHLGPGFSCAEGTTMSPMGEGLGVLFAGPAGSGV